MGGFRVYAIDELPPHPQYIEPLAPFPPALGPQRGHDRVQEVPTEVRIAKLGGIPVDGLCHRLVQRSSELAGEMRMCTSKDMKPPGPSVQDSSRPGHKPSRAGVGSFLGCLRTPGIIIVTSHQASVPTANWPGIMECVRQMRPPSKNSHTRGQSHSSGSSPTFPNRQSCHFYRVYHQLEFGEAKEIWKKFGMDW